MRKGIMLLSVVTAFSVSAFADNEGNVSVQADNVGLETQVKDLQKQLKTLEKKVKSNHKKASQARTMANGNHLKFDVDFRTTMDKIDYTFADGSHAKNNGLLANRLYINMKYDAGDKVRFYGTAAFNKAFGFSGTLSSTKNASFDWVTNENLLNEGINIKEAYWLYSNNTFLGTNMAWTASIGRRPSMDGLGINFREGNKRKSAIASTVNVEFDGASFKWNLNKVTPLKGSWFKLCMGRGLTSATPRFSNDGADYSKDEQYVNSDMLGFLFVPYDDGQYSLHTNYAKSYDMIGYGANPAEGFKDFGDLDLSTVMVKADGIGDGINDFLDDTILFVSYSQSKTHPKNGMAMLGSTKSETGKSAWMGIQMPCPLTDDGRLGFEYNKGSKYWRSVTYAEDTMVGSKIAARGDAKEVYWIKPLTKSLSMSARYTQIDYNYTGSNAFFGQWGKPMTIAQAKDAGMNPVKKAEDFRVLFRYKY